VAVEKEFASNGKASFSDRIGQAILSFLCRSITDADPIAPGPASLGTEGPSCIKKWLGAILAPLTSSGVLPKFLDELTIHLVPIPFWFVSGSYKKLYNFLWTNATTTLDGAERQFGLNITSDVLHLCERLRSAEHYVEQYG